MKSPLDSGPLIILEEATSTQDVATEMLRRDEPVGAVLTRHQTGGRGRFGRPWVSGPNDSLTVSLVFSAYTDHPRPHLIGMTVAVAAAKAIRARLQWPNDLVAGPKKVGGILTELVWDAYDRRVPVVGMGINLNQTEFPAEISDKATSLGLAHGGTYEPEAVLHSILERLEWLPEPSTWGELAPSWMPFDATPGKLYKLGDGREAVALAIGPEGQLVCTLDGEFTSVLAADAIFGCS